MQTLLPVDGGPIYAETDLSVFISEPWNAIFSLAIALPSIYWAFKLQWNIKDFKFLYFLFPLLFLGGIGSVFFHAFRASPYMLMLDIYPTALVTLSVGIYFWCKVLPKWWLVLLIFGPLTYLRLYLFDILPYSLALNIGYFITGSLIFLPLIIFLIRNRFEYYRLIIISVLCLSISLLFRRIDFTVAEYIPIGSHFLWHILSGIGAFYIAEYLYLIRLQEINNKAPQ
jgi:hypothetical protein